MVHFLGTAPLIFLFTLLFISQIRVGVAYSNVSCIESERKALLQFKKSLIDSKSKRLSSWTGEECCAWEGVGCNKTTGHVIKLDLHNPILLDKSEYLLNPEYYFANPCNNCLGGQLDTSLLNLKYLQYLDLSFNNFSEYPDIPPFLGLLKDLRYLNLSSAGFAGEIPPHFGNLSSLQYLDLSNTPAADISTYNFLTAKSLGWVVRLSSLKRLHLSQVKILDHKNWLWAINMLPSLTSLKLDGCQLQTLPYLSHVNLTSLASLDLKYNQLNSSFPLWLFNLTGLIELDLGFSSLRAPIDDAFEQMTSLVYLDLSGNYINASIPKSLCNMSRLAQLDLRSNGFTGSIPSEIGHLGQLTTLVLSSNNLNGSIPSSLWQLKKLQTLDVSGNQLTGVLSELYFAKLKELKELSINENDLDLNFSSSWIPPFQLRHIDVTNIKIGPRFPSWLQNQKELEYLSLRATGISDTIPNWFRVVCYNITFLDLSDNNISGNPLEFRETNLPGRHILLNSNKFEGPLNSFPADIVELDLSENTLTGHLPVPYGDAMITPMEVLKLKGNHLTGSIPTEICKMNNLQTLDLSNNQLTGRVPSCLGNLQYLGVLNLANNSFSGPIPGSLGNLENLVILYLNRNKFTGRLRLSPNLKSLLVLDLGENGLEDILPAWIWDKSLNLKFLRLQSNNFHGSISYKLCQLSDLQVLNLAENNLIGSIPRCFNNFSMMANDTPSNETDLVGYTTYGDFSDFIKGHEQELSSTLRFYKSISLSRNKLAGAIPEEIMQLAGLRSLNLSQNHLSGRIPNKIGDMKYLETLDLSMNELVGAIPPTLSALNWLSSLNVSYNKLSGRIPTGRQLQTLTDPSIYQGNSGLCGMPLLNNCSDDKPSLDNTTLSYDQGHEEFEMPWFYAGIGPGFAVGLIGVLGILHFKKSWRMAYFEFVENAYNPVWDVIALKASPFQTTIHSLRK